MNREMFILNFISTFCANWCSENYIRLCANGQHEELNYPPIEDAVFLANKAWEEYCNICRHEDSVFKTFEEYCGNKGEKWNGKLDIKQFAREVWKAAQKDE